MDSRFRKVTAIIIFLIVIVLSFAIFFFRETITNVSDISYIGLFILCFFANSTVLLPSPGLVLVANCALIMNPVLVALCAGLGLALGEFTGYMFGAATKTLSPSFQNILDKTMNRIKNPVLLVFILAALPLPLFDVVGIYSGAVKLNPLKFFLACFIGKFLKALFYTKSYDLFYSIYSFVWSRGIK